MKYIAILIGIVLILGVLSASEAAYARAVTVTVTRDADGVGWSIDVGGAGTGLPNSTSAVIEVVVYATGVLDYLEVSGYIREPGGGSVGATSYDPLDYTTPIMQWGLSHAAGLQDAGQLTLTSRPNIGIYEGGFDWKAFTFSGVSSWSGSVVADGRGAPYAGNIGVGESFSITAWDSTEPLPELPPGAMQMMVLMFGSALTWVKMRMK